MSTLNTRRWRSWRPVTGSTRTRSGRDMLSYRLPLPSYLRSDGTEMFHRDLFGLADQLGLDNLRSWFVRQFADPVTGREEWQAYLSGQYVCLHSVTPWTIQRKGELVGAIQDAVADPQPRSTAWLDQLHDWVDQLDVLAPAYTGYDVLRFGGPTGRQTNIDAIRAKFPRPPLNVVDVRSVLAEGADDLGTGRQAQFVQDVRYVDGCGFR
ncbi:DUF6058 family natural product biosynthesis protein [Fodinicola feengrottensis]|uniref:DUF6058 family natural product biosynthesis protein n=1 Tax=Fodinicola feengrottensis TaxID=435914 RepID=UPI0036F22DE5